MKILVTGGLGFVGANLLPKLINLNEKYQLIALDNLSYCSNPEILPKLLKIKNFEFIRGNVCNYSLVNDIISKVDHIIHLAAETAPDRSIENSKRFFKTNVIGTHSITEAVRKNKERIKKFVHVSTDEVWGETLGNEKFSERSPYNPRNPYSASKAGADHLVRSYGVTYHIPYCIVHFSNLYGPYQYPEKLIPKFITRLLLEKRVGLYGDGKNIRDWLYIDDACEAIFKTLKKGRLGQSYAFGGDSEYSNLEITKLLLKFLRLDESFIEFISDRPGHDWRYAIDFSKAKKELGWSPKVKIKKGLLTTTNWYKENKTWWKKRI